MTPDWCWQRDEGARTYYSINWERFDGDLTGFLAYVEKARNAPPDPWPTQLRAARRGRSAAFAPPPST